MKVKNAFANIILLILIFNVQSLENPIYAKIDNFKPFISTPIIENYVEPPDDFTPASFAISDKTVKCLYINEEYNVYDISRLGVNALNVENKEEAHIKTIKKEDQKYTIYFNFCYNLKSSSDCKGDKKQIYMKVNDGECKSIAGDIKSGNKWNSTQENFTESGEKVLRNVLKIQVNEDESSNSTFEYRLVCDKGMDKKEFKMMEDETKIDENDKGGYNIVLYIKSYEACEKINFYFIWKFIEDYKPIFIIALMLFGILNCINTLFGDKFVKLTTTLIIIFGVTILFLILSQYMLPSGCAEWIIWVMLFVGLILGVTAGVFVWKYNDKVISFICGGVAGFFLGQFLYSFFGNLIDANSTLVYWLFVVGCILILIGVAFCLKKQIIIVTTSFIGAYCFIRGISLFGGGFPDEITIMDLRTQGETEQIEKLLTWKVYVYLSAMVVVTILATVIQCKYGKYDPKKNDNNEEAPDTNLIAKAE